MQQELLIKVLGMTTSVHDGEALAAIRKANELLKAAGVTWREYIEAVDITRKAKEDSNSTGGASAYNRYQGAKAQARQQQKDFTDLHDDEEIEKMLDHLMKTVHPTAGFRTWVESVNDQFHAGKELSEKQLDILRKSTARSRGFF